MYTINKIMCEPFEDKSVKTKLVGDGTVKVAEIVNTKSTLVKLKVLAPALWYLNGHEVLRLERDLDCVYVRADLYASVGKDILTNPEDGSKFIFIPFDRVEIFSEK